ncbi:MAG: hypothetical protein Q8J88_10580 [Bacteroidales bacterium]|nr:hypothetical protein [Bacteroidales bacterium]
MEKEARYFELIDLQQASGLSVTEFCSNEGIAVSTFYYWNKKRQSQQAKNDFIPLIISNPQKALTSQSDRKLKHQGFASTPSPHDILLEVVYPNGTIIRARKDIALNELRALVQLFD